MFYSKLKLGGPLVSPVKMSDLYICAWIQNEKAVGLMKVQ